MDSPTEVVEPSEVETPGENPELTPAQQREAQATKDLHDYIQYLQAKYGVRFATVKATYGFFTPREDGNQPGPDGQ